MHQSSINMRPFNGIKRSIRLDWNNARLADHVKNAIRLSLLSRWHTDCYCDKNKLKNSYNFDEIANNPSKLVACAQTDDFTSNSKYKQERHKKHNQQQQNSLYNNSFQFSYLRSQKWHKKWLNNLWINSTFKI